MKIVVTTPYFYPKSGGLESYAYFSCMSLLSEGVDVRVITSQNDRTQPQEVKIGNLRVNRLPILAKVSNTPINPKWFISLYKFFISYRPDIVITNTPVPFMSDVSGAICRILGIPYVVVYHGGGFTSNNFALKTIMWFYENTFERILLSLASHIVVLNEYVKLNKLNSFAHKITVIPPGLTITNSEETSPSPANSFRLLFVGNLDKANSYKGLGTFLSALRQLVNNQQPVKAIIVGGGDSLSDYKKMAKKLKLDNYVEFLGSIPLDKLPKVYSRSDILVFPSLSDVESLGLVLLEAMSFGLPIVASKVGGVPFIMTNNRNGILFEPGDDVALAAAVSKIVEDKKLFKSFSQNNLNDSKQYSWEKHTDSLLRLLESSVILRANS